MVLALEDAFISMCQSSGIKLFISIAKLSGRCFCYVTAAIFVSLQRTQTWRLHTKLYKFEWHNSANSVQMKNSRYLIPGEVVFLARLFILQSSFISQILEFIYWMVTTFSFDHMTGEKQELVNFCHLSRSSLNSLIYSWY